MQRETKAGREERVKTLQIELHVVSPEPSHTTRCQAPVGENPLSSLSNTEYGGVGVSHVGQPTPIHPFLLRQLIL